MSRLKTATSKIIYYEDGQRKSKQFKEVYFDVVKVMSFIKARGIKRGDRIGILGKNSYEWVVTDLACVGSGCITVPLEPNHLTDLDDLSNEYQLILIFTNLKSNFWVSSNIIPFTDALAYAGAEDFNNVQYSGLDIFTFNFTSGTSGKPKAIELRKHSFDHLIAESQKLFKFGADDTFLVFLPLNVYLERCYIYSAIIIGFNIVLVSAEMALKALRSESPTVLIGVPYFFESIQNGFLAKMKSHAALNFLLKSYISFKRIGLGFLFNHKFFPFTGFWGGKMKYLLSGSAPIKRSTLDFYELMGVKIYEGYGMNEIGGMITLNYPDNVKKGSVGKVFPGKSVSFDEAGQIIVKSDFHGNDKYFKENQKQDTYLSDNRVATGDVGYMDGDGFIYITGRIKDTIIFSNGLKVHPASLEEKIEETMNIKNCCVFGDGKPYLTALVVPADTTESWEQLDQKFKTFNENLPAEKQVKNFLISNDPFSVDNGLLTPAFKRNRRYIYQKYALEFEKLY